MDYKELARMIAASESPYEEFEKQGSSLDDTARTTLAREVNKQFFLNRVSSKSSDGDIVFDVITPSITGTHVKSDSASSEGVEKTASDETKIDKSGLIDDSMFVIKRSDRFSAKTTNSGNSSFLMKTAEDNIAEHAEDIEYQKRESHDNGIKNVIAEMNESRGELLDTLSKVAADSSELRTVILTMVNGGLDDFVDDIVAGSHVSESEIVKVASVPLDDERQEFVEDIVNGIAMINEAKEAVKSASSEKDFEKLAFLGAAAPIIGALRAAYKGTRGAMKAGLWIGKKAVKHPGTAATALAAGTLPGQTQKFYLRSAQKIGAI
jgi:beta-phosphoglucomutase-like phosphatase (HAD superfamily)